MVNICFNQNSVTATGDSKLQQTLQLKPESRLATAPIMVNHVAHAQLAANIPDPSTQHGVMDGNKTFPSVACDNTRRRYKREAHLKFSEGNMKALEASSSSIIRCCTGILIELA